METINTSQVPMLVGTSAERLALIGTTIKTMTNFYERDTNITYFWDGTSWKISGNSESFFFPEDYQCVGDGVTDDTVGMLNCINAASGSPIYLSGDYYVHLESLTDQAMEFVGRGSFVHGLAHKVMSVNRTFGAAVDVSSITTVVLGVSTGGAPNAALYSRINFAAGTDLAAAGYGIGTVCHIGSSVDYYNFSAQQSAGFYTFKAETCALAGIGLAFDGKLNGGFGTFDSGANNYYVPDASDTIVGEESGATARMFSVTDYGDNTGVLMLTGLVGIFVDNENILVNGQVRGVVNGPAFVVSELLVDAFTSGIKIRSIPQIKFRIADTVGLKCSGDQDSLVGAANRLAAFELMGLRDAYIGGKIYGAWSRAVQLWSCWRTQTAIDVISLPNNASNVAGADEQAYGYGVEECGASKGGVHNLTGGNCRHVFTTNTTWASAFASVNFKKWGAPKNGYVSVVGSANKTNLVDTHAGCYGYTLKAKVAGGFTSVGRYLSGAVAINNRGFASGMEVDCDGCQIGVFDNSPTYDSGDFPKHRNIIKGNVRRFADAGIKIANTGSSGGFVSNTVFEVHATLSGDGTTTPYAQHGITLGNGLEVHLWADISSCNNGPISIGGFGKTHFHSVLADYNNSPNTTSALRIDGNSAILYIYEGGYKVRQKSGITTSPSQFLRVTSSVTVAPTINIAPGGLVCLNHDDLSTLLDESGLSVTPAWKPLTGPSALGLTETTFANLPSVSANSGRIARVSNIGIAGSYWVSDGVKWRPQNGVVLLSQTALPTLLPSSGSIGNNGALTGITALPAQYAACYMYFPANAISAGSAAGLYYVVMSSTTAGTIYNNTYTSGTPTAPASPTPFVTTGPGAYTQTTGSDITLLSFSIVANLLGTNGRLSFKPQWQYANSGNNKIIKAAFGGQNLFSKTRTTTNAVSPLIEIVNQNATGSQINIYSTNNTYSTSESANALTTSVDTTADQSLTATVQLATATDWAMINYHALEMWR